MNIGGGAPCVGSVCSYRWLFWLHSSSPSQRSRLGHRPRIAHRSLLSRKARSLGRIPPRPSGVRPRAIWWRRRPCPTTRRSWTARTPGASTRRGGSDVWAHGGEYVSAGASISDARFKLKTPTSGDYALYAWWPVREGNSRAARFGVDTARGTKWVEVNQAQDGGMWVKLGTFEMKAGDRYVVRISPGRGSGEVIADAVALVRGAASPPPDDLAPAEGSAG